MPPEQKAVIFALIVGVSGLLWIFLATLWLTFVAKRLKRIENHLLRLDYLLCDTRTASQEARRISNIISKRVGCLILFSKREGLKKAAGLDTPEAEKEVLGECGPDDSEDS